MPELHHAQDIADGVTGIATVTKNSIAAYAASGSGIVIGVVVNHWLAIISAMCMVGTFISNHHKNKQLTKESELRMQIMHEERETKGE